MLTRELDYDLPEGAIADRPAPRGESRLLVLDREGRERHSRVRDLPRLLRPGDLVVVNDTRVIPARLFGSARGGPVELLLVEKVGPRSWEALAKPGKRARPGTAIGLGVPAEPGPGGGGSAMAAGISAEVLALREDGRRLVRFSEEIEPHLDRLGHVPLPPYIKRPDDDADRERYQTVYARHPG